ncbi:hypothetical protein Bwad001_26630 [Bilophila wadsworthia]
MIAGCLGCGIGAIGVIGRFLCKGGIPRVQSAEYFIGRHMKKAKCGLFKRSKKRPPVFDSSKQGTGTKYIGTHESVWIKNASVDMAFRRKVDYSIGPVRLKKIGNKFRVSDIALYKDVSWIIPKGK